MLIKFNLRGETALWRIPAEALGAFSAPGPSPSQIAGILGAAQGFKLNGKESKNGGWDTSIDLINWLYEAKPQAAIRLTTEIKRSSYNVNGIKNIKEGFSASNGGNNTLRIQQRVIDMPNYEIVINIEEKKLVDKLFTYLKKPTFPIYLGNTHNWGKITNVDILQEDPDPTESWAYITEELTNEEYQWATLVNLTGEERLTKKGFLNYPRRKLIKLSEAFFPLYYGEPQKELETLPKPTREKKNVKTN